MAEVVFLTGAADKLGLASRLLRKKLRDGARVAVYGPAPLLTRLDQMLWADDSTSFVPHVRLRHGQAPAPQLLGTQLWLLDQPDASLRCDSAVNLGVDRPDWCLSHDRIAELIGPDPDERHAGRQRWKHYESQGHRLSHHPQDKPVER